MDKENKLILTKPQAHTLENVFNWALNLLEEETKKNYIVIQAKDGLFEKFDFETESKKIVELFEYLKKHSEVL